MSAEAVCGQLSGAFEKLEAFSQSINRTVQNLAYSINSPTIPPGVDRALADQVLAGAKELLDLIAKLVGKLTDWLAENVFPAIVGPYTLYTAGNKWTTTVYKNLSTISGQLNAVSLVAGQPSSLNIDHRWALRAGHRQLSASLLEAFDSAHAAGATDDAGAEPTADLFGELQSIVNAVLGEGRHA